MNRRSKILKSPKLIEKKRAKIIRITLIYLLCLVVFISGTFFTLRLDNLQITRINSNVSYSNEIANKVNEIISDNYLYLFPKSNIWLYPKSDIKKELLNSFNTIDNLSISANGLSGLDIKINEREPIALACDGFTNESENHDCYFIDKNGLVYSKTANFSDGTFFKYYLSTNSISDLIGKNLIDNQEKFIEINNFIESIKKSGIKLTGLLFGDDGQYEMYAKNYDESDMVIYFNDRISLDKIASNLIAFIEDSKVKKNGNNGKINFESINLRFGNNIYYVAK
jgi:hypothetical protein